MINLSKSFYILQIFIIGITLMACTNEDQIREQMLKKTPVGKGISDVKAFCISENLACSHSDTAGYWNQYNGKTVGVKSIWAVLSEYKTTPLTITTVTVYWGFDSEERLVDIFVWKTIDAP